MRTPFALAFLPLLVSLAPAGLSMEGAPAGPRPSRQALAALARLPVPLVENLGQWPEGIHFAGRTGPWTLQLRAGGWDLGVRCAGGGGGARGSQARLSMLWEGASTAVLLEPEGKLAGAHNFLLGADPVRWRAGAAGFASVRYLDLYAGIDVRMRFEEGRPEYDLLLAPGADLSRARLRVEGAERLAIGACGSLMMATAAGTVRQPPPLAWIEGPGGRRPVAVRYLLLERGRFGFAAPDWDGSEPLVIDPWFESSTYLGGTDFESPYAAAIDLAGVVTVAGEVDSLDFPATPGVPGPGYRGGTDAFVARFDPTGSKLLFATYLGGTGYDVVYDIGVDANGATLIAGHTDSPDFPVTAGAFDTTYNGGGDAFAARLAPGGNALLYATYLGGPDFDSATALHVGSLGEATLAGLTSSPGFPVTAGAYDTTFNGNDDAFLARLDPAGSALLFATFLGGTGWDSAWGVDVDLQGRVTVSGDTDSSAFPVTPGAFKTTLNQSGWYDSFVARFDGTGATLLWATYLGGDGDEFNYGVKVDGQGRAFVAGVTDSSDFPVTPGSWSTKFGGVQDAYVAGLDSTGAALAWSTYLGGIDLDFANRISVDPRGMVTVAGETDSLDFPTTPGAPFRAHQGGWTDAFVARFGAQGERLTFSTFLGGSDYDAAWGLAVNLAGQAAVAGMTFSGNFPVTPGAFGPTYKGNGDGWVARLRLELPGVARYGSSIPACLGQPTAYVSDAPRAGSQRFGLACSGAPPSAGGVLLIGTRGLGQPLAVFGVDLWIDALSTFFPVLVGSDGRGEAALAAPIPLGTAGARLFFQFLWVNTAGCGGAGTLSSSDALDVLIQ